MIAGWYPPCQAWPTAARRIEGLVEGAAARGWSPTVLTPDQTGLCRCRACSGDVAAGGPFVHRLPVQPSTLRRIGRRRGGSGSASSAAAGDRLPAPDLAWALLGMQTDWVVRATRAAQSVEADALLTTAGPFENILIGRRLQRALVVPWVADLRDPASVDVTFEGTRWEPVVRWSRSRYRAPLQRADRVVAATHQVVTKDQPWLQREIELLVPGFDEGRWEEIRRDAPIRHERFDVVFTGRLYSGYRGPEPFLRGLRDFSEEFDTDEVRLVYYGRDGAQLMRAARAIGCDHLVVDAGFIDPDDVPARLASASVLLLLTNEAADSGVPGGKFYEYLGARRPILAVPGVDRFVEQVLHETGAGTSASSPAEVAAEIARHFRAWRRHGAPPYGGVEEALARYASSRTSDRLVTILDDLVAVGARRHG